jgi:hypothetical protein
MEGLIQFAQAVVPGSARVIVSVGDERNALLLPTVDAPQAVGLSRLTSRRTRMPARRRAGIRAFRNAGAVRRRLGLPDDLVGEEDDVALDGPGVDEAHRFLVAGLAE